MFGIGAFAQTPFASLANIFHEASVTENSGLASSENSTIAFLQSITENVDMLEYNAPEGSVLQCVNSVYNTYVSTASTSYVDTGLTASITPKSATSKILVVVSLNSINTSSTSYAMDFAIVNGSNSVIRNFVQNGSQNSTAASTAVLDSPATTSAYTYKIQYKINNAAGVVYMNNYGPNNGNTCSTITLLEIAQ